MTKASDHIHPQGGEGGPLEPQIHVTFFWDFASLYSRARTSKFPETALLDGADVCHMCNNKAECSFWQSLRLNQCTGQRPILSYAANLAVSGACVSAFRQRPSRKQVRPRRPPCSSVCVCVTSPPVLALSFVVATACVSACHFQSQACVVILCPHSPRRLRSLLSCACMSSPPRDMNGQTLRHFHPILSNFNSSLTSFSLTCSK